MAESRDRNDTGFQNEPLTPGAPDPRPEGEVSEQSASVGGNGEAPLLNVTRYPDATGDLVETAYPGQDAAIDGTQQQSRVGSRWPDGHVSPGMEDRVEAGDGLHPVSDDGEARRSPVDAAGATDTGSE